MKNNTFYTEKTMNVKDAENEKKTNAIQYKESDFFVTTQDSAAVSRKKYTAAQAKIMALVIVVSMVVAGAAALIVTSLAKSYSDSHKNSAIITVKKQHDAAPSHAFGTVILSGKHH